MDISGIQQMSLTNITGMIEDYNENIRYYNRNIRDFIEIYREVMPRRRDIRRNTIENVISDTLNDWNIDRISVSIPSSSSSVPTTRPLNSVSRPIIPSSTVPITRSNRQPFITNNQISYPIVYDPFRITGHRRNNLFDFSRLENVVVRPNNDQIRNATQILEYNSTDFSQRRCPITLEAFEAGQEIRRIIHCGHIFDNTALIEWFERNVRCPVCRHDIRDIEPLSLVRDNSGNPSNTNNNSGVSNIIEYGSESEEDNERQEESQEEAEVQETSEEEDIQRSNLSNRFETIRNRNREERNINETTNIIRHYLRDILTSVVNDNSFPELNDSVNSVFATYNIPLVFDISYSSI